MLAIGFIRSFQYVYRDSETIEGAILAQAAQAHYVWVPASEVIGRNILELLVYYLMPNKCKNLKDMKSPCLSI